MRHDAINGHRLFQAFRNGATEVISRRQELDRLNFYPVPDGDTGSNLSLTMKPITRVTHSKASAYLTLASVAEQALRSARGNSGLIFAQFLQGLHKGMSDCTHITLFDMASMSKSAAAHVYDAVERPVEGTMLTVIREWSEAVENACNTASDFHNMFESAFETAQKSLKKTRNMLKENREHGSVDAGALGFVYFLEGMLNIFKQKTVIKTASVPLETVAGAGRGDSHEHNDMTHRYCFNAYIRSGKKKAELVSSLKPFGESLIVIGDEDFFRIHLHTDSPASVMEKLTLYGLVIEHYADDMLLQKRIAKDKAKVLVVTDSLADMPETLKDELNVATIPVFLIAGEQEYLDRLTVTGETLPGIIRRCGAYPKSAQPSAEMASEKLYYFAEHANEIIILSVSSRLSGTYNAFAKAAKKVSEETGTPIRVIDTRLNSGAQGLVVKQAAEDLIKGLSAEEIILNIRRSSKKTKIYVALNTLSHMVRGGRISRIKGIAARLLNLKPVVTLDETGRGAIAGRAFSKKGAVKKILTIVKESHIKRFCVVHSGAEKEARELSAKISAITGRKAEYIDTVSPVISLNSGKGSIAVCFECE